MELSGDVLVTDQQPTGAKTEQSLGKNCGIQQTRQKLLTYRVTLGVPVALVGCLSW